MPLSSPGLDPDADPAPHLNPVLVALVFVGGVAGTAIRAALEAVFPAAAGAFPLTTLLINVSGSFILGGLLELLSRRGPDVGARRRVRLGVGTGLLGGYTTYSTFAVETLAQAGHGHLGAAAAYVALSVVLGFLAAAAAMLAVRRGARA